MAPAPSASTIAAFRSVLPSTVVSCTSRRALGYVWEPGVRRTGRGGLSEATNTRALRGAVPTASWFTPWQRRWEKSSKRLGSAQFTATVGGSHHPPPLVGNHYLPGFYCVASWRDNGPRPVPATADDVRPDTPTCFILHGILGSASTCPHGSPAPAQHPAPASTSPAVPPPNSAAEQRPPPRRRPRRELDTLRAPPRRGVPAVAVHRGRHARARAVRARTRAAHPPRRGGGRRVARPRHPRLAARRVGALIRRQGAPRAPRRRGAAGRRISWMRGRLTRRRLFGRGQVAMEYMSIASTVPVETPSPRKRGARARGARRA
jgi:hypothetical protein